LYDRHTTYLYRFALRFVAGDVSRAEDVVHDAWLAAVRRLPSFEWRSAFRTWLAGFVVHCSRAALRHDGDTVPLANLQLEGDSPGDMLDRVDLERTLAQLAPRYREVLVLHDVEGYTHEEIALMLGIESGTSRSQLTRARAAARRLLGAPSATRISGE
jgi:RNA polymerase sigma-70 factor (ECF subfamily)